MAAVAVPSRSSLPRPRSIAEIAPHVRRTEQIVEHVRIRMAQQICGDLSEAGVLKVLRLGNRWDMAFHQALNKSCQQTSI